VTTKHVLRRFGWPGGIAAAAVLALAVAVPAFAVSGSNTSEPSYVDLEVPGRVVPLVSSGEEIYGDVFEGIPDGIGVVPGPGKNNKKGYVDLYVAHEQSHVPFSGFADYQDSSVSRVRVDIASKSVTDLDVALSPSLGFIRFCSAFMAGPEHGFPHYTFLVNEESNDILPVPPGAPYAADPFLAPNRQAGYSAHLDTVTGKVGVLASAGRHNHENQVIVPAWKKGIVALSGDDTFSAPSSQLYMFTSQSWKHFQKDEGKLWAFRVTATQAGAVNPTDPFNDANDYLEITPGLSWKGEFIPVPDDVARGTTAARPQDALENWSNANNVFQFVRVEDIGYDPDNPRVVYFADTGTDRLAESTTTGRLFRGPTGTGTVSNGRIFKMVLNADDPTKVDEFSILADALQVTNGAGQAMRNPDNLDVGRNSIMVQEDPPSNAKLWMYSFGSGTWTHVATANQPTAETSGIVDVSRWFGDGWWALDVQSHVNQSQTTGTPFLWDGPPGPAVGTPYQKRREKGQLLLMQIPGS
jgi:hypothetical protein